MEEQRTPLLQLEGRSKENENGFSTEGETVWEKRKEERLGSDSNMEMDNQKRKTTQY